MKTQAREYSQGDWQYRNKAIPASRLITARINLLAILFVGLLIGVLVGCASPSPPMETPPPPTPTPVAPTGAASPSVGDTGTPTPVAPTGVASPSVDDTGTPTPMDIMVAQTRHFQGDPNAPVTIIEFGDFQ